MDYGYADVCAQGAVRSDWGAFVFHHGRTVVFFSFQVDTADYVIPGRLPGFLF